MADQVERVTEQQTQDAAGRTTTTRAVSADSRDAQVNKVEQVVWFVAAVLAILLGIRLVLSLLGANLGNGFADFIYSASGPFVRPFQGLFNVSFERGVGRFELETLVAIVVYVLLAWIIVMGIRLAKKNTDTSV